MYCAIMHAWVKLYGPHAETTPLAPTGLAFARWQVETDAYLYAGGGRKCDKLSNFSKSFAKVFEGWFL
jgi:hypothetical protein